MQETSLTLFIDLASADRLFALAEGGEIVGLKRIDDPKAEETLMLTLASLLAETKRTYEDMKRIAAVLGPGGFMSIRVGVSLANALSYGLKIPSAGIHASDLWQARALNLSAMHGSEQAKGHPAYVWLHSTKRDQLFVRGFGQFETVWTAPRLIDLDALKKDLPHDVEYVGELIPEHAEALKPRTMLENIHPIESALLAVLRSLDYKANQTLLPWYGREV